LIAARLKYETLYTDGRGNLKTVIPVAVAGTTAQAARTFSYNGVGELISAWQPESGLTAYDAMNRLTVAQEGAAWKQTKIP
jgi:hypothetical protein